MGKMKEEHIRFLTEASKPWEDFRTLKVMKLIEDGDAEIRLSQGMSVTAIEKRAELKIRTKTHIDKILNEHCKKV